MDVADTAPLSHGRTEQVLLALVASLWWGLVHVPRVFLRYYGVLAFKKALFRVSRRRRRQRSILSPEARRLVHDYRERQIAVSDRLLDEPALRNLNALLDACGCRDAVRRRKVEAHREGRSDFFHLSQEELSGAARDRLFATLPGDFVSMIETARGRGLRCTSVTYHETDADDPTVRVGSSRYNAHPFHIDGNPKFAKALIYLTDVDGASGPFEMFSGSRGSLLDELLRLAYQEKHFRHRPRGLGATLRAHLPVWFRRPTHFWDVEAEDLQRRFPNALHRVTGKAGSVVFFDGMNVHNGSRDQTKRREVLHFIFM